jgi:hypothetical protein
MKFTVAESSKPFSSALESLDGKFRIDDSRRGIGMARL